jgi:hypothetical protein
MKNWFRALSLASVLSLVYAATAGAQFQQYGSCVAYCDGEPYELSYVSYGQCCFNLNHFSNTCYSTGFAWYPYGEGDSMVCGG